MILIVSYLVDFYRKEPLDFILWGWSIYTCSINTTMLDAGGRSSKSKDLTGNTMKSIWYTTKDISQQ